MANPAESEVQNLLPVQAYFDAQGNFQTFIGQGQPFYATANPQQSGLNITSSTINSTTIGAITPSTGVFTSIATTTGTITTAPSSANDIANKQYVDFYAAGLSWKAPVLTATSANITLSGLQTINGVTVVAGDRVLVKDQSTASQNGIYIASASAWSYAVGADDWAEYVGAIVFIVEGSLSGTAWYCTAQPGGTLGVTAQNWSNFSVASSYTAGTGLTLTGTQFSITNTGVSAATYGSASAVPVFAVNAQGQLTSVTNTNIAIGATQITSGTIDSARISGAYSGITGVGTLTDLTVSNPISGSITGNAATTTSLSGGASGSIPYQTASSTTSMLAKGNDGQILSLASGLPTWIDNTVGTVTAVTASAPLASSGGTTPNLTITQASSSANGYLSSTDWNTFNGKANSGANSDITSMTGITGGISSPDYIAFDTGYSTTLTAGQLGWDGNNTLGLGMIGGNVIQHIGEDQFFYVKASSAITKGEVIMFTGAVGASGVPTGAPATGITDGTYIMGIAAESIALNGFGLVQTFGTLRNVNTSGYADGDILWYDPAVTGGLTKTKPVAPNVKVQMAAVINGGSSGGGTILIRIDPGSTLGGSDSNAQITSPSNGQIISYDGGNGYWKNTALTAGTGISVSASANGVLTIANTATTSIAITDDTTTNATRYLAFTSATSGSITGADVSSTKLQYNPSTGVLSSTGFSGSGTSLTGVGLLATASTYTALQTFAGTSSNADLKTSNILETATISATAATGTIQYDVTTQSVLYYTTNASGNFTVNFRGSSGTSLNTIMATGESLSATFLVTNGATAYYNSAVTIDGNSVTPKWQGGTAPTSGNASSIDSYTYVIFKTGSAAFTVLASVTKFA